MNIYQLADGNAEHTILDLGANVGLESEKLLKFFHNSKVISVEPVTANICQVVSKAQDYKDRWFIEHCAVDLADGFVKLGYQLNSSMSGNANGSLDSFNWETWHYDHAQICRTKTLAQICTAPTLVKVDIERHEYVILPELVKIPSVQAIFVELHGYCKPINTAE